MGKSINRACRILKLIAENKEGLRYLEIAKALKIPSSSLSGILPGLINERFLSIDPSTKRYLLGPEILLLAGNYLSSLDIVEIGKPVLRKLMEETGESSALSLQVGHEFITMARVDSPQPLRPILQIGERRPLYATASGKAFLAFLPEHELEQYLASVNLTAFTSKTITDPKVLRRRLEQIRATHISYNRKELSDHIIAMATTVFNFDGKVVAAIVVSLPEIRFTSQKEKLIERALKEGSMTISSILGFKGQPAKVKQGSTNAKTQALTNLSVIGDQ
jgi:DNA-binding IclR family transcriptional regulator